uniref:Uncharacterized protein n=1 Tax=Clastoptera arizonana TaxID=38151 RepID=A0A1B6CB82_9HEMI
MKMIALPVIIEIESSGVLEKINQDEMIEKMPVEKLEKALDETQKQLEVIQNKLEVKNIEVSSSTDGEINQILDEVLMDKDKLEEYERTAQCFKLTEANSTMLTGFV